MPRISLRAYEKQIEDLIEQNKLQEAAANCKHILRTFPKCISTYRILGKSYLEGKEYGETADIFKRVLMVFPDDFISHVGMSIVRENENDLDAAIWHMELAFDSQPSNIAIQEELKRLFGRRDGTHPAKIRLTRGALVRMYARGELFQQAIAEIKSALVEDPKRLDLKVLLAKMNYLMGEASESLTLCNQLILDLPYCYEINKLMVALLPTSNNGEKISVYLDRLEELNPYEEFVGEKYATEADVPDDQVMLDTIEETKPGQTGEAPVWVKTTENKREEPASTAETEWLPQTNAAPNETAPTQETPAAILPEETQAMPVASAPSTPENQDSDETELPDWMRTAGWLPTNEPAESSRSAFMDENNSNSAAEAADLPDWLQALAPQEPENTQPSDTIPSVEQDKSVFVPEPMPEAPAPVENKPEENAEPANAADTADTQLPDWLRNFENESVSETASDEDIPDWLKTIQQNEQDHPEPAAAEENPVKETPSFTALESAISGDQQPAEENEPAKPLNQNTRILDSNQSTTAEPETTLAPESAALPEDWKSSLLEETPAEEPAKSGGDTDLPEWIRSVMDKTPDVLEPGNRRTPGSGTGTGATSHSTNRRSTRRRGHF